MWRNYLVTALRVLARSKGFAAINIAGLSVALAAGLLVLAFVRHELSYDRWIPDHERIMRVESTINLGGTRSFHARGAPFPAKKLLEENLPGAAAATRYTPGMNTLEVGDRLFRQYLAFVDPGFFEVFDLPFVEGGPETALADPDSIVLAEATARRLFGDGSPMGRTLSLGDGGRPLKVSAVLEDMPANSHFHPSQGIGLEALVLHNDVITYEPNQWGSISGSVYLKFSEGADIEAAAARLDDVTASHLPQPMVRPEGGAPRISFTLRPLADIHLAGRMSPGDDTLSSGLATVVGFALVGAVILALAAVNFTNLSLVRSLARTREVALRKVAGASRQQIAVQFLGESVLVVLLALAFGVALAELLMPLFSKIVGSDIVLWNDPATVSTTLLLGLGVALTGGAYPALVAARYGPGRVMGGESERSEAPRIRAALTLLQFAAAIGLVVCTIVVFTQLQHLREIDLGYHPADVVVVYNPGGAELAGRFQSYADALVREPGVLATATAATEPFGGNRTTSSMPLITDPEERINLDMQSVSHGYFETLDVAPLYGRLFARERASDSIRGQGDERRGALIMNQSAALALGFESFEAAIGDIRAWPIDERGEATLEIVGIVPDLMLHSLKDPVEPTFFFSYAEDAPQNREARVVLARPATHAREDGLAAVDRLWRAMFPDQPISRQFLDAKLAGEYEADARRARGIALAAATAILIAAMGLYGMAGFSALQRTHEIAMRKVLGARIRDLLGLLLWQFTKPVLIANLIAWPVAGWLMHRWLQGFAYRIELTLWPFLLAGAAALAIALLTVSGHAWRVARTHPALALREE